MQVIRPSSRTAKLMQKAPGVGSPSQQCSPNWALGPGLEFEHVMLGRPSMRLTRTLTRFAEQTNDGQRACSQTEGRKGRGD